MGLHGWMRGLVAGLLLAAGAGCESGPRPLPWIRLGYAAHDHHAALYVAARNPEYFREHGGLYLREVRDKEEYELVEDGEVRARVRVAANVGGAELIRRLAEDQFDVTFGGFPAMVRAIDAGHPIRVVAPVMAGGVGLLVRSDLPVGSWEEFLDYARSSPRALRIGYKTAVSVQNLVFEQALREEGIPVSSALDDPQARVSLLNLHGPENLTPGLESGLLDGFVVMQPYLALAEERGAGRVVAYLDQIPGRGGAGPYPCCALAARASFLEEQGTAAEALVRLLLRASRRLAEAPAEQAAAVAAWLRSDSAVERRSLGTIRFTVDFDAGWEEGTRAWVADLVETGVLAGEVREAHARGVLADRLYDQEVYRRAREGL